MITNKLSSIKLNDLSFCEELTDEKIIGGSTPPEPPYSKQELRQEGLKILREAEVKDAKWVYIGIPLVPSQKGGIIENEDLRFGTPDEVLWAAEGVGFDLENINDTF